MCGIEETKCKYQEIKHNNKKYSKFKHFIFSSPYTSYLPIMDSSKYHLNTVYMTPSHQLTPGPYQYLKTQLSHQNYFNPRYIDKSPQTNLKQTMGQLNKLIAGEESIDPSKLAHVHSIKLHPIINENFISSFDESQYRLEPSDKVKIVKEKVFRVQNYYNYLYELQVDKEHKKMQQRTQALLNKLKNQTQKQPPQQQNNNSSPKPKHSPQRTYKQTDSHVIGSYEQSEEMHLAPEYSKYKMRNVEGQKYFLKEKDRRKVEESNYRRF